MAEASIVQAEETDVAKPSAPTPEQLTAIKAAIANAQTLEEVQRLESALKQGKMPSEMLDPGNSASMYFPVDCCYIQPQECAAKKTQVSID